MNFKDFLINENKMDLGIKIGDILNSITALSVDMDKQGKKLNVFAEDIISRVQAILRSGWSPELKQYLQQIRNAVIEVCKSLDGSSEKPLPDALKVFSAGLQKIAVNLGTPINDIGQKATKKPEESAISQPEKPTVKAIIPKTIKVIEPTAPGGPPSEPDIPLGGSTGALKNL